MPTWQLAVLVSLSLLVRVAAADITTGLQAYWAFSENTGTSTADSSGNSNTGTLSGANLPTWTSTNCAIAPCLTFEGTTALVTVTSSATVDITTGDFSLATRVYPTTVNSVSRHVLQKNSSTVPNYQLMLNSSNVWRFIYEWSGGNVNVQASGTVTANTAYCLVATAARAGNSLLYVNKTLQTSQPASNATTLTNSANTTIGGRSGTSFFIGNIDEVRIYNRVLTQTDVNEYCDYTGAAAAAAAQRRVIGY